MFKKRHPAGAQRRRLDDGDAGTEAGGGGPGDLPTAEGAANTPAVPLPRAKAKKAAKKAVVSFGDDEEPAAEAAAGGRHRKTAVNPGVAQLQRQLDERSEAASKQSYTAEVLDELKRQQKPASHRPLASENPDAMDVDRPAGLAADHGDTAIHVPTDDEIRAALRLRKERQAAMSALEETAPSFVPLSETSVSRRYGESRLVSEEQEIEGEEAFEDYEGTTIAFGRKSAKQFKEMAQHAIQDRLDELAGSGEPDDDEVRTWELQRIHTSAGADLDAIVAARRPGAARPAPASSALPIPEMTPIPLVPDIAAALDKEIALLASTADEHTAQLNAALAEISSSEDALARMESELKLASERYEYFQQLSTYIADLDEFLDVKDLLYWSRKVATKQHQDFRQKLDAMYETFSGSKNHEPADADADADLTADGKEPPNRSVEDIIEANQQLLSDAASQFRKLSAVKERFQAWKQKYPKDYDQAYGALSLAGAFSLHVRHEMFGWNPFTMPTNLEATAWHAGLSTFGIGDDQETSASNPEAALMTKVTEKIVIPLAVSQASIFDPFDSAQAKAGLAFLSQLLDYTERSSPAFKSLVDAIFARFKHAFDESSSHSPAPQFFKVTARAEAVSAKSQWFACHLDLLSNLLLFSRYIDVERLKALAITTGIDHVLVPALSGSLFFEDDLAHYEAILSTIPPTWLADDTRAGMAPALLRKLEQALIASVCVPAKTLSDPAIIQRIMDVCVSLKSFDWASRMAKTLKQIKSS
ncbi:hypothetical protein HK105_201631 [Polyrhizophydium stewartii]|uniref:GCF C-terminal domain-containing protein n=1 Tax=Polyrhizophydium stewartii TaxID=2732419 RepID=A0ABR4NH12_9FUNG